MLNVIQYLFHVVSIFLRVSIANHFINLFSVSSHIQSKEINHLKRADYKGM